MLEKIVTTIVLIVLFNTFVLVPILACAGVLALIFGW